MKDRILWNDGARWRADDATFAAFVRQLDGARDVIVGLDVIADRLHRRAAEGAVNLDEVAANEGERAVLTAALLRCVDDAEAAGPEALGLEGVEAYARYLDAVRALRDLVQTDVTW